MQYNFLPTIIPLVLIPILLLILWRIMLKRLKIYISPSLGKIEVFQKYNGEKVLTINSYVQGISIEDKSIKESYWYSVAENASRFCTGRKNPKVLKTKGRKSSTPRSLRLEEVPSKARVLMLGLGANTISNLIAKINPKVHQTIVEFDEQIIQACKDFFNLDGLPNHRLIHTDAFKMFNSKLYIVHSTFDVIIVDIFTGNPPYISLKSNEPSFIEKILPYLKKDGMIIFNRPAHNEQVRSDGQKLKKYLDTLFVSTEIFDITDPRGFRNYVITAEEIKIS